MADRRGRNPDVRHEEARLHRAARQRGGRVAARGACEPPAMPVVAFLRSAPQRARALVVRSVVISKQPIAAACQCINLMQAASLRATRTAITTAEVFEMQDKNPQALRIAGELVPCL